MRIERLHTAANVATGLAWLAILGTLYLVFVYVPTERTMGIVQRIFYYHVPSAMMSFLAFFIVLVASVAYLITRRRGWDITAQAAAELGVVFCSIVLITGPIWAKPIWGIWWTWDARLTLTLVTPLLDPAQTFSAHALVDLAREVGGASPEPSPPMITGLGCWVRHQRIDI